MFRIPAICGRHSRNSCRDCSVTYAIGAAQTPGVFTTLAAVAIFPLFAAAAIFSAMNALMRTLGFGGPGLLDPSAFAPAPAAP